MQVRMKALIGHVLYKRNWKPGLLHFACCDKLVSLGFDES